MIIIVILIFLLSIISLLNMMIDNKEEKIKENQNIQTTNKQNIKTTIEKLQEIKEQNRELQKKLKNIEAEIEKM